MLDKTKEDLNIFLDSNNLSVDANTFDALTDLFYNRNSGGLTHEIAFAMAQKDDEKVLRLFSDFDYRYAYEYLCSEIEDETARIKAAKAYVDKNPGLKTRREEEYNIYKNGIE